MVPLRPRSKMIASNTPLWSSRNGLPFTAGPTPATAAPSSLATFPAADSSRPMSRAGTKARLIGARSKSNVPSLSCTMWMSVTATSFRNVSMYPCIPPATTFSSPCEAGVREGMMVGVRKRREDLCVMSNGRKAYRVAKGASSCVVSVSDQEPG